MRHASALSRYWMMNGLEGKIKCKSKKMLELIEGNGIIWCVSKTEKFSLDRSTFWLSSFEATVQKQPKWAWHSCSCQIQYPVIFHKILLAKEKKSFSEYIGEQHVAYTLLTNMGMQLLTDFPNEKHIIPLPSPFIRDFDDTDSRKTHFAESF